MVYNEEDLLDYLHEQKFKLDLKHFEEKISKDDDDFFNFFASDKISRQDSGEGYVGSV